MNCQYSLLPVFLAAFLVSCASSAEEILGFDVSNASVPTDEILRGGPPPDGIPSIDRPRFTPAGEVDWLKEDDLVIGFSHGGTHRAYPFRILVWHEIVNDTVGGLPIAVVYCPLCGTATVFDRRADDRTLTFGVSGLLFNSDVLLFDRGTRSLWSQLKMEAVSGERLGTELEWLPSRQLTWGAWKKEHPRGEVLNRKTGHSRDYDRPAYASYEKSSRTMFPYQKNRDELRPKEWVVGVLLDGKAKAYPLKNLPDGEWVENEIGGEPVRFRFDENSREFTIRNGEGRNLPVVHAYWFAWQAFYPDTEIWKGEDRLFE